MRTWQILKTKSSDRSDEDECSWQKHTATLHPITAALHNKKLYLAESLKTWDSATEACWPVNHEKVFCVIPQGGWEHCVYSRQENSKHKSGKDPIMADKDQFDQNVVLFNENC